MLVLTIGGLGALAAPAGAHDEHGARQSVRVTLLGAGSTAQVSSHEVHPGVVRFTFTGSTTTGASATVVSLHHGVTLAHFLADLTTAASQSAKPAAVIAAIKDLDLIAVAYGGGDTLPGQSVTDAITLPREGTYYVVNTPSAGAVNLATIEAEGSTVTAGNPAFSATVTLGDETKDVITTSGELPRHGTIRVTNDGTVIHLLQMTRVADGVTDPQVQAEYDLIVHGGTPTSDPAGLMGPPTALVGTDAISPERSARLTYSVPKGTYLLQCFVPDDMTGLPHAFMGMHLIVVID
ncbi:MAG TPA: hypothetical protein VGN54_01485 [Mycobacteriales bacterium]|nr:hypothetical protein [Mycobacteriales bacterium]